MRYTVSNSAIGSRAKSKHFRTFYITVFLISGFAVLSLVADRSAHYLYGPKYGAAQRQAVAELDVNRLLRRGEECRLVHHAEDKCAFIKASCSDEEVGLLSYLSLYYCALPQAQPVAFIILILWLALLFSTIGIAASEFFCINLSTISSILGMSESMAGVTFLAFGNGSPDVLSTFAAMSTHSGSLAVGELIGAAGFITAVVAGSMALVREFKVGKRAFVRDVGFFVVAASFSMISLADGALHFWECCVMIGYYLFYVATVVTWHWYLQRRRKQRERNALARGQYVAPGNEEIEVLEEDGDDENTPLRGPRPLMHDNLEDFSALERGGSPVFEQESYFDDESDGDDEQGRLLAAEVSNSMRVTRPRGSRRSALNPIRPSLVGALEFRSVLSNLQKSRSLQVRPIHLRRYSHDPTASSDRHFGPASETAVTSAYADSVVITEPEDSSETSRPIPVAPRTRAVSMDDAGGVQSLDPAKFSLANVPKIGIISATPTFPLHLNIPAPKSASGPAPSAVRSADSPSGAVPTSPTFSLLPPPSDISSRDVSSGSPHTCRKDDERLASPEDRYPGARHLRRDIFQTHGSHPTDSPTDSPRTITPNRPQLVIPGSRDSSRGRALPLMPPFPKYTDSPGPNSADSSKSPSLLLPEAHIFEPPHFPEDFGGDKPRRIKWWPYRVLPDPRVLHSTLLPTLCSWEKKSIWDKFLGVISAPSIFLLTVTLPVVETESDDNDLSAEETQETQQRTPTRRRSIVPRLAPGIPYLDPEVEPEWLEYRRSTQEHHMASALSPGPSPGPRGLNGHHNSAELAVSAVDAHYSPRSLPTPPKSNKAPAKVDYVSSVKDWNRWLVAVQIFTAPLYVMIIIWANGSDNEADLRHLLRLVLYALLGSAIAFAILLLTTTAEKPPRYRFLFCFVGFVVSIAWISTIANEVVGVLKAFGVILGISDAILGLTIFAVGNSLGDLVADITVARLGFPVMALSACFGGPMMNILLGIGVSGLYMTIKDGHHKHAKHPDRPMKYKPYQVQISGTLMVSGITLLVTLVGLLIAVPLNKWVMSRRIGWGLIILWSVSTIINIVVEITGVWPDNALVY